MIANSSKLQITIGSLWVLLVGWESCPDVLLRYSADFAKTCSLLIQWTSRTPLQENCETTTWMASRPTKLVLHTLLFRPPRRPPPNVMAHGHAQLVSSKTNPAHTHTQKKNTHTHTPRLGLWVEVFIVELGRNRSPISQTQTAINGIGLRIPYASFVDWPYLTRIWMFVLRPIFKLRIYNFRIWVKQNL